MKIYLEIRSWVGTCAIGAEHYYGKLVPRGKAVDKLDWKIRSDMDVELERPMTTAEAIHRNKKEHLTGSSFRYKKGDKTNGFMSEDDLRAFATKVYKKSFPKAKVLIEKGRGDSAPSRILDGPKELIERSKPLLAGGREVGLLGRQR